MKNAKFTVSLGGVAIIGLTIALWLQSHVPQAAAFSPSNSSHRPVEALPAHTPPEKGMSSQALVAKMREWRAITDKNLSDQVEMALTGQLTDANVTDFVRGLPPELLQTPVGLRALERWTRLDQRAAVTWLASQAKPTPFQIMTTLRGWAETDEEGVQRYIAGLPAGPWRETVLTEVSRDALRSQHAMVAVNLLRKMSPGDARAHLLIQATQTWAQTDPEAALQWVAKVDDPSLHNPLIAATALGYATTEPEIAAEWLRQSLPPGEALNNAMGDVVGAWAADARPAEAAAWVAKLPEGGMRDIALAKLIEGWRQFEPDAVAAWIKGLPDGPLRKQAADLVEKSSVGLAAR